MSSSQLSSNPSTCIFPLEDNKSFEGMLNVHGRSFLVSFTETKKDDKSEQSFLCSPKLCDLLGDKLQHVQDVSIFPLVIQTFVSQIFHRCSSGEEFLRELKEIVSQCLITEKERKKISSSTHFSNPSLQRIKVISSELSTITTGTLTHVTTDFSRISYIFVFVHSNYLTFSVFFV